MLATPCRRLTRDLRKALLNHNWQAEETYFTSVLRALDIDNISGYFVSIFYIDSQPYKTNKIAAYRAATRSSSIIPTPPPIL